MLLETINGKPYMASSMTSLLSFSDLESSKVKVTYILRGRRGVCYTYIGQYVITTVIYVTEGAYAGGRGFPLSQRSFLYFNLLVTLAYIYATYMPPPSRPTYIHHASCRHKVQVSVIYWFNYAKI